MGLLLTGCSEKPPVVSVPEDGPVMVNSDPADGATDLTGDKLTLNMSRFCPDGHLGQRYFEKILSILES